MSCRDLPYLHPFPSPEKSLRDFSTSPRGRGTLNCERKAGSATLWWQRYDHGDTPLVRDVGLAEGADEIVFFELDRDQHVAGGHQREEQVAAAHHGRCPEGEGEAQIDRVAHIFVEEWRLERGAPLGQAAEIVPYLVQAEEIEVVDQ